MKLVGIDLEGVLVPEIWVGLSKKTGLKELALTTKDIPNYNELMQSRIKILNDNNIKAKELFDIASEIDPYEGAVNFLDNIRDKYQVIILSDTFFNLSLPIFKKLSRPTVFCHYLSVNNKGMIEGYKKCTDNHKKLAIKAMNNLGFDTVAIGDSYNDLGMLEEARKGILFKSTEEIIAKYPNYLVCNSYHILEKALNEIFNEDIK